MNEIDINHIEIDLDGDGIPEKYILKDKALNELFLTLANIAFSSDYNDLINQPDSLPASDVYEWAKNIAKPEYTKNEIGLENVDNTSDLNKPVSIAQQKAIDDAYANSNGYTDQKISELINGAPTSLDTLGELAKAMTDNADVVSALEQAIGSKANSNEFDSHVGNDTIHITSSERNKWNSAISGTDDTKDNIVSFTNNDTTNPTSWSDVSALTSGEKHTSIFTKISTMFKNIRYLYKLIGTTDISAIGNGTVTGGLSALNSNLINLDNNTMKCTYIGEGVNAGANERRPYYDFSQISGDGVFLVLNSNGNLSSNYYKGCIVFKTYASITIIGDNNEWSTDGMVLTGIMCSWNANLYVYRML